ncbi:MAG TPA: hypothetical protein VKB24_00515, partial [Candidatus Acidoferrum sp.]|nr:hypothetical protein [Candidatus Acidoferrum sp.]
PRDFQVILNTAAEVFPHVSFFLGPEQGLLVASASPLSVDYQRIAAFDHTPPVREELDIIRRHSLFSVLGELALDDPAYRHLIGDSALSSAPGVPIVSSDAFPYLEYQTPKGNVLPAAYLLDPRVILDRRPPSPASAVELRNTLDPTDRDYVDGLALVHRGDLAGSLAAFARVRGRNRACAEQEIAWVQGIQRRILDRSQPIPPSPGTDCP